MDQILTKIELGHLIPTFRAQGINLQTVSQVLAAKDGGESRSMIMQATGINLGQFLSLSREVKLAHSKMPRDSAKFDQRSAVSQSHIPASKLMTSSYGRKNRIQQLVTGNQGAKTVRNSDLKAAQITLRPEAENHNQTLTQHKASPT